MHIYIYIYVCIYIYTYMFTYLLTWIRTYIRRTDTSACMHACMHVNVRTGEGESACVNKSVLHSNTSIAVGTRTTKQRVQAINIRMTIRRTRRIHHSTVIRLCLLRSGALADDLGLGPGPQSGSVSFKVTANTKDYCQYTRALPCPYEVTLTVIKGE